MKIECPRGLGKPEGKCKFHGRNLVVFLVFSPFMNSTFLHSCHIAIWEPQSIWKFHWLLYCGVDHQSSGDKTVLTSHLVVVFGFTAARWYTYQAIKAFFGPAFVAAQTKKRFTCTSAYAVHIVIPDESKKVPAFSLQKRRSQHASSCSSESSLKLPWRLSQHMFGKKLNNPRGCFLFSPSSRHRAKLAFCQWHCKAVCTSWN